MHSISRALLLVSALAPVLAAQSPPTYRVEIGWQEGLASALTDGASSEILASVGKECPFGEPCYQEPPGAPMFRYHAASATSSAASINLYAYGYKWPQGGWPAYAGAAHGEWNFDDVVFSYPGGTVPLSVGVNFDVLRAESWGSIPPGHPDVFHIDIAWTNLSTGLRYQSGPSWDAFGNTVGHIATSPSGSWLPSGLQLWTNTRYALHVRIRKVSGGGGGTDQGSITEITFAQTPFTISSPAPTPGLRADSPKANIVDNQWNVARPGASPTLSTSAPVHTNQTEEIYVGGAAPGTAGLLFIGLGRLTPGLAIGPWWSLDLLAPLAITGFVADAQGRATLPVFVPPGAEGSTLALQAVWLLGVDPAQWYGSAALPIIVNL